MERTMPITLQWDENLNTLQAIENTRCFAVLCMTRVGFVFYDTVCRGAR